MNPRTTNQRFINWSIAKLSIAIFLTLYSIIRYSITNIKMSFLKHPVICQIMYLTYISCQQSRFSLHLGFHPSFSTNIAHCMLSVYPFFARGLTISHFSAINLQTAVQRSAPRGNICTRRKLITLLFLFFCGCNNASIHQDFSEI